MYVSRCVNDHCVCVVCLQKRIQQSSGHQVWQVVFMANIIDVWPFDVYVYIWVCMCMWGCASERKKKREGGREGEIKRKRMKMPVCVCEEMREMFNFVHERTCNIMCCHNHDFVFFLFFFKILSL